MGHILLANLIKTNLILQTLLFISAAQVNIGILCGFSVHEYSISNSVVLSTHKRTQAQLVECSWRKAKG